MYKIILIIAGVVFLIGIGYGIASWKHQSWVAGYTKREQQRINQISANEAEQNKLRGENQTLREHIAKLSAEDEGLKAIINSRGGAIANEAKNLEAINEELKNNQAVIANPTDRCIRCREFSIRAIAGGQISKPLSCKDECIGSSQ